MHSSPTRVPLKRRLDVIEPYSHGVFIAIFQTAARYHLRPENSEVGVVLSGISHISCCGHFLGQSLETSKDKLAKWRIADLLSSLR